jgi:hypothetical protein
MKHLRDLFLATLALCALLALPVAASSADADPVSDDSEPLTQTVEVALFQEGDLTAEFSTTAPTTTRKRAAARTTSVSDQLYAAIKTALLNREATINLFDLSIPWTDDNKSMLRTIYSKVINDNPELFYVDSVYGLNGLNSYISTITPNYNSHTAADSQAVSTVIAEVTAQANTYSTDLEKALFIHDYLVENIAYDWAVAADGASVSSTSDVFNVYGALVNGDAVCQGYALAYQLLLSKVGIESVLAESTVMNHAWNLVKIGTNWYHVDVTWDDPTPDTKGQVMHSYFMLSDDTMISGRSSSHHDWFLTTSDSITCTDKTYETNYIFSGDGYDGAFSKFYKYNGYYYYIKDFALYRSDALNGTPEQITEFDTSATVGSSRYSFTSYTGFVWMDGFLYYAVGNFGIYSGVNVPEPTVQLLCFDLLAKEAKTLSEVQTFSRESYGSKYTADQDFIGLTYNEATDTIDAVSTVGRKVIASVKADSLHGALARFRNVIDTGSAITFTLIHDSEKVTAPTTLSVACYNKDGKLVALRALPVTWNGVSAEITVDLSSVPAHTRVKAFLTDASSWVPLCADYDSAD